MVSEEGPGLSLFYQARWIDRAFGRLQDVLHRCTVPIPATTSRGFSLDCGCRSSRPVCVVCFRSQLRRIGFGQQRQVRP